MGKKLEISLKIFYKKLEILLKKEKIAKKIWKIVIKKEENRIKIFEKKARNFV